MCCADMMSSCVGLRTKAAAGSEEPAAGSIKWKDGVGRYSAEPSAACASSTSSDSFNASAPRLRRRLRRDRVFGPSGDLLGRGSEQRARMYETALGEVFHQRGARVLDPWAGKDGGPLTRSLDRGA